MLNVLVVNDQVTPMEFVVSVLQEVFGHSEEAARKIALLAHLNGDAICGVCRNRDDALALVRKAEVLSQQRGYRLGFSLAPVPFWQRVAARLFHMAMKLAPVQT